MTTPRIESGVFWTQPGPEVYLVERFICNEEAGGPTPPGSTTLRPDLIGTMRGKQHSCIGNRYYLVIFVFATRARIGSLKIKRLFPSCRCNSYDGEKVYQVVAS